MMDHDVASQLTLFIIMFLVGITLNPMNVLASRLSDIYVSQTLIYSGLLMASNMLWSHQIVNYLNSHPLNEKIFLIGISMSVLSIIALRNQLWVGPNEWLKRMIGHHSTAVTTTNQLLQTPKMKEHNLLYRLAKDIVYEQEREILLMKSYLQ